LRVGPVIRSGLDHRRCGGGVVRCGGGVVAGGGAVPILVLVRRWRHLVGLGHSWR
jgi:hypothetical protein